MIENTLGNHITCLVPKRQLKERKNGQWHQVHRTLFPGYLIFKSRMTTQLYYQLKQIPIMAKLLKDDDGPLPKALSPSPTPSGKTTASISPKFFKDQTSCPADGIIDWSNVKVTCSIHFEDIPSGGNEDEDDNGGEVPYL